MADTARGQLLRHAESDSPAILYDDLSISWRDYVEGANLRAGVLSGMLDPMRPRHVATLLENTPEMLYALAAGAFAGHVTVGPSPRRRRRGGTSRWGSTRPAGERGSPVTSANPSAR